MERYRKIMWVSTAILVCSSVYLAWSVMSHDADNPECRCILCLNDGVSGENEYLYNHYLLLISIFWVSILVAMYCGLQIYRSKR